MEDDYCHPGPIQYFGPDEICNAVNKTLMLENGKIIEQGAHRELMQIDGKYAELYKMQAKRYLESD